MSAVFHGIATLSDWVLGPLVRIHPVLAMVVCTVATAVLVLVVYKHTSNQKAIVRVKKRVKAHFLAMSLYKDSLRIILRSSGSILGYNAYYLGLNLVPLAVMIIPLSIFMVQLDGWFGYGRLTVGEHTLVSVKLDSVDVMREDIELELSSGLATDAPPVRIPSEHCIVWRVRAQDAGEQSATVRVGDSEARKLVPVGDVTTRVTVARHAQGGQGALGLWNAFFHPGEGAIDAAGIASIALDLPGASMDFWIFQMHWIWAYLILTILFALALKGRFKVTF